MKQGWEYKKLGEVCKVLNGYAFKSNKYSKKGTRVIRISNVQKGCVVDEDPKYYSEVDMIGLEQYVLYTNDLLMSLTGNVGRVGLLTENMMPAALNQRVACLRLSNKSLLIPFLYHCLNSNEFEQNAIMAASGVAQKNLSSEWVKNYRIPLPPLSEQQTIVAELDKISELIDKGKEQLKELDNLAQAIFYDMFGDPITNEKGWDVKTIGEIGRIQRGSGIQKKDFVEKGRPCIHYGQIHTSFGTYTKTHISEISEELFCDSRIAHTGDLLMVLTSEDVEGSCKSTAWLGDYDIAVSSDAAILSSKQNALFLSFYTRTKAFYLEKEKYARGFKVTHIKVDDINKIPVYLPPLPLQQSFAEKIEAIEKQKALVTQSIQECQTLFDSRMDYYFGD